MFERFTEKAIKTIMVAQQEARRLQRGHVGTEHLLLGLVDTKAIATKAAFKKYGIKFLETRRIVEELTGRGKAVFVLEIPFNDDSKRALEFSWEEGRKLQHDYISTAHLLLGILRQADQITTAVFAKCGVDPSSLRATVLEELTRRDQDERKTD